MLLNVAVLACGTHQENAALVIGRGSRIGASLVAEVLDHDAHVSLLVYALYVLLSFQRGQFLHLVAKLNGRSRQVFFGFGPFLCSDLDFAEGSVAFD